MNNRTNEIYTNDRTNSKHTRTTKQTNIVPRTYISRKNEIVESISGAGSVEEAKTIFETLQNTVLSGDVQTKSTPNTLSEAVKRNVSPFASRNMLNSTPRQTDTFSKRMQQLAGINKE